MTTARFSTKPAKYWNRGPHQSLYIPTPLRKKGENRLVLFELEQPSDWLQFVAQPIFQVG
jgi:beta-galactosidase